MNSFNNIVKKKMEKAGYLCHVTEHWNSWCHIRQDMFGFIDMIAIHPKLGNIVFLQITSRGNKSSRLKKIRESPIAKILINADMHVMLALLDKQKGRWRLEMIAVKRDSEIVYENFLGEYNV